VSSVALCNQAGAGAKAPAHASILQHEGTTVKKLSISVIAIAIGLAFSFGAMAQGMSKDEYKASTDAIVAEFKSAKASCDSLAANAKDVCMADANGKEKVAKAELEARYKPNEKARYDARIAKAQADYSVAKEKCDDKAGNEKDVCVKEAKAAETGAKADAKAQMKISQANKAAKETSGEAQMKANEEKATARKAAAEQKRDADYAVAKEKCDVYAGGAKDYCVNQAKARFGKS